MNSKFLFKTRRGNQLLFFIIIGLGLLGVAFRKVIIHTISLGGQCYILKATKLKCHSCGGTRALNYILKGDIISAFYYNPLFVIVSFILFVIFLIFGFNTFKPDFKPFKISFKNYYLVLIVLAIIVFLVVRNLPFYRLY